MHRNGKKDLSSNVIVRIKMMMFQINEQKHQDARNCGCWNHEQNNKALGYLSRSSSLSGGHG